MTSNDILLRLNFKSEESNTLGILVIGNDLFCIQLCEALQICHKKSSNKYKLYLVSCSKIEEVLYYNKYLHIDYVVFLLDTRLKSCAIDVDYNLQRMDKSFVCGRMCIVNANPHLSQSETNVSMNEVIALKKKYDAPLLNGGVMDSEGCTNLAKRLLILIENTLSVSLKTPFIQWLFKAEEKNEL